MATRYLAQLLQPGSHQTFKPLPKLKQVVAFLTEPNLGRFVHLIAKVDENLTLSGNPILFQEMISCLVTNGFEAYQKSKLKMVVVSLWADQATLYLTITDFGEGMTWLTQKLSLKKGFSIKEHNTGYGLWFVEQSVHDEFKGEIFMSSQPVVGTSIRLELPLRV